MVKRLAIIPARSGSKGLPNKNILMLLDRPLIAYSIQAAKDSGLFDKVIVSTDSYEYKMIAEYYGADVLLRGSDLSNDYATSYDVIKHVLQKTNGSEFEYFALLQPTSPLRSSYHIIEAIEKFESDNADFLVSVTKSDKSSSLIKPLTKNNRLDNFNLDYSSYRRQENIEYYPNGAIFIGKPDKYLEQKHFFGPTSIAYVMNKYDSIDIDDKLDFYFAIQLEGMRRVDEGKIKNPISYSPKEDEYKKNEFITLIGHSFFSYWNINKINGYKVKNKSYPGITIKEYLDRIKKTDEIDLIGDKFVICLGINEIKKDILESQLISGLKDLAKLIRSKNNNPQIFFIEICKTRGRIDLDNSIISKINERLQRELTRDITFIKINKYLSDEYGSLALSYTKDGLHLNDSGYNILKERIENVVN